MGCTMDSNWNNPNVSDVAEDISLVSSIFIHIQILPLKP